MDDRYRNNVIIIRLFVVCHLFYILLKIVQSLHCKFFSIGHIPVVQYFIIYSLSLMILLYSVLCDNLYHSFSTIELN